MVKSAEIKENYLISKSNELIYANYELTLQEQRLILAIVSLVDSRDDKFFSTYELKVSDFAELLGLKNPNYSYIQKITAKLMTRVVTIETEDSLLQTHWLSECEYFKNKGTVEIKLSDKLAPYFLQLKTQFTKYQLSYILRMKSRYSIRIYEILKANQFKTKFSIQVDELREIMKIENYKRFSNFNQKVLQPALREINSQTDIVVSVEVESRRGKSNILHFQVVSDKKIQKEVYENLKKLKGE